MRLQQGILAILTAGFLAITSVSAVAEINIAVVDVARAVLNSEAGKQGMAGIQDEFGAEEEALQEIQKEATALLEKLKKDTEFMSEQEFGNLLAEIQEKNSELATRAQTLQRLVEERRQRVVSSFSPRVRDAIEQLVKDGDYDIILPRAAAVYSGELYDVTLKLTETINAQEKPAN